MFKSTFLLFLSLIALSSCFDLNQYTTTDLTESQLKGLYNNYMLSAPFYTESTPERYNYFKSQVLEIIAHNQNPAKTWTRAINRYTGLTLNELRGSAIMDSSTCDLIPSYKAPFSKMFDYPTSLDWRTKNVVSPVKNQGDCAACWAFSATGAIEAHWAIQTGSGPVLFSEQQLLDCAGSSSDQGCNSGLPSQAFDYLKEVGGINTENVYPYTMYQEDCDFNTSVVAARVQNGSVNIAAGDEGAIMAALNEHGPVSVGMDATEDFMSYDGGIYVGQTCGKTQKSVNHAVLIVGYGTDEATGMDYWIVKNSWGRTWGEEGYFRIQRGVNMCGIAECASFPGMAGVPNGKNIISI